MLIYFLIIHLIICINGLILTNEVFKQFEFKWQHESKLLLKVEYEDVLKSDKCNMMIALSSNDEKKQNKNFNVNIPQDKNFQISLSNKFKPNEMQLYLQCESGMVIHNVYNVPPRYLSAFESIGIKERTELVGCLDITCHSQVISLRRFNGSISGFTYGDSYNELLILLNDGKKLIQYSIISGIEELWTQSSDQLGIKINTKIIRISYDWLNKILYFADYRQIFRLERGIYGSWKIGKLNKIYEVKKEYLIQDFLVDPVRGYLHLIQTKSSNNSEQFSYNSLLLYSAKQTSNLMTSLQPNSLLLTPFLLTLYNQSDIALINTTHINQCSIIKCRTTKSIIPPISSSIAPHMLRLYKDPHGYLIHIVSSKSKTQFYQLEKSIVQNNFHCNSMSGAVLTDYLNKYTVPRYNPDPPLQMQIKNIYVAADKLLLSWNQPVPKWFSTNAWRRWEYNVSLISYTSKWFKIEIKVLNKTTTQLHTVLMDGSQKNSNVHIKLNSGNFNSNIEEYTGMYNLSTMMRILFLNHSRSSIQIWSYSFENNQTKFIKQYDLKYEYKSIEEINERTFLGLTENEVLQTIQIPEMAISYLDSNIIKYEIDPNTNSIFWLNIHGQIIRYHKSCDDKQYKEMIISKDITDFTLTSSELVLVETKNSRSRLILKTWNGEDIKNSSKRIIPHTKVILENKLTYYTIEDDIVKLLSIFGETSSNNKFTYTGFGLIYFDTNSNKFLKVSTRNSFRWKIPIDIRNFTSFSLQKYATSKNICESRSIKEWEKIKIEINQSDIQINLNKNNSSFIININESYMMKYFSNINVSIIITFSKNGKLINKYNLQKYELEIPMNKLPCSQKIEIIFTLEVKNTRIFSIGFNKTLPCFTKSDKIINGFMLSRQLSNISHQLELSFEVPVNNFQVGSYYTCFINVHLIDHEQHLEKIGSTSIACNKTIVQLNLPFSPSFLFKSLKNKQLCVFYIVSVLKDIENEDLSNLQYINYCNNANILNNTFQRILLNTNQTFVTYGTNKVKLKEISLESNDIIQFQGEHKRYQLNITEHNDYSQCSESYTRQLELDWLKNRLFLSNPCGKLLEIDLTMLNIKKWYVTVNKWSVNVLNRTLWIKSNNIDEVYDITSNYIGYRTDIHALSYCNKIRSRYDVQQCSSKMGDVRRGFFWNNTREIIVMDNWYQKNRTCLILDISKNYELKVPHDLSKINCELVLFLPDLVMKIGNNQWIHSNSRIIYQDNMEMGFSPLIVICEWRKINFQAYTKIKEIIFKQNGTSNVVFYPNKMIYSIYNLIPGTQYEFIVEILREDNKTERYNRSCITSPDVPNPIFSITYPVWINKTHVEITWQNPSTSNGAPIIGYYIKLAISSKTWKEYSTEPKIQLNMSEISKSPEMMNIKISIAARNIMGYGDWFSASLGSLTNGNKRNQTQMILNASLQTSTSNVVLVTLSLLVIVIILGLITIVFFARRWFKVKIISEPSKFLQPHTINNNNTIINDQILEMNCLYNATVLGNSDNPIPLTEFDKIPHFMCEKIRFTHLIGKGAFGSVYKGILQVSVKKSNRDEQEEIMEDVALKMRNEESVTENEFKREAVLMWRYSHPYIVRLLGVTFDRPDRQSLVLEYMERGNLRDYLRRKRYHSGSFSDSKGSRNTLMSGITFIDTAFDILKALVYLEENRFIHRDIAARNCLVSHKVAGAISNFPSRITKLGDFGLSRDTYEQGYYRHVTRPMKGPEDSSTATGSKGGGVPVKWMAPETLKDGVYSGPSDVWSWAVLCWEVLSMGAEPYPALSNRDVVGAVLAGQTPGRALSEDDTPLRSTIESIMSRCWRYYPEDRPTFRELESLLLHASGFGATDFTNNHLFVPTNIDEPSESSVTIAAAQYTDVIFRSESQQEIRNPSTSFQVSSIEGSTNNEYDNEAYEQPLLQPI